MTDELQFYGEIRIAAATEPALMAVAKIEPDRLAAPVSKAASRLAINRKGFVFIVHLDGIAPLQCVVEDTMRWAHVDAVVVGWRNRDGGRELITDVAVRAGQQVTWHHKFKPWLDAQTKDLWLVPEAPDTETWFKLSEKCVAASASPPFMNRDDRCAGFDRFEAAMLVEIKKVLAADPIGISACAGAI